MQPLFGHRSAAFVVDIGPVRRTRRMPVDPHIEPHGGARCGRAHELIRQPGPITDRTAEITFLDPGAQAYAFTFG